MNGISHPRFAALNFIAAFVWATMFAGGGYLLGVTLENFLGKLHGMILLVILGIIVFFSTLSIIINRLRGNRDPRIQRLKRMQAFRKEARERAAAQTAGK